MTIKRVLTSATVSSSPGPLSLALGPGTAGQRGAVLSSAPGTHMCFLQSAQSGVSLQVISMASQCLPPQVILFYPLSETLSRIRVRKLHPSLSSFCAESKPGNVMNWVQEQH